MNGQKRIAVLGGGAWGTALAVTMARAGHAVQLWARDAAVAEAIATRGENPAYLPDIRFNEPVAATTDPHSTLEGAECILCVVPAQATRAVLGTLAATIPTGIPLVMCSKGIERDTGRLVSQIAREILPGNPVAALSGPSFATDVVRGLPTAVTVAAQDEETAFALAALLSAPGFRCYSSGDLVGVELGGALKNVMAIAAGAVAGAGLGASAQAATVTRGFVELRRLGETLGARPETLMGLSGLGDLILTCASPQSRNFAYGMALGAGRSRDGLKLAEGAATAAIAARLSRENAIAAPIIDAVTALVDGAISIEEAAAALLARPLRSETD